MTYLISPPEETNLSINSEQFITNLKQRWQTVKIRKINNPDRAYSLEWIIPMEQGNLEGLLERTGQCVSLEGHILDCAKFALWFRSQIDSQYKLVFYDEGYSADIELYKDTTQAEIVQPFISIPVENFSVL